MFSPGPLGDDPTVKEPLSCCVVVILVGWSKDLICISGRPAENWTLEGRGLECRLEAWERVDVVGSLARPEMRRPDPVGTSSSVLELRVVGDNEASREDASSIPG